MFQIILLLITPAKAVYILVFVSRMEETTQPSTSQFNSVLVVSPAPMLVKGDPGEKLVLPSLSPPGQRRREREELVCGTVSGLTISRTDRMFQLKPRQIERSERRDEQGIWRNRESVGEGSSMDCS